MDEIVSSLNTIFDKFQNNILLGFLFIIFAIWVYINYFGFYRADNNDIAYKRTISWIENDTFAKRYLYLLNKFILFFSNVLGDKDYFENIKVTKNTPGLFRKLFGFNPFTAKSYDRLLLFSFFYSMFSFYFTWVISGNGNLAIIKKFFIEKEEIDIRFFILFFIVFYIFISFNFLKKTNLKIVLFIIFLFSITHNYFFLGDYGFIGAIGVILLLYIFSFIFTFTGSFISSYFFEKDKKLAYNDAKLFANKISIFLFFSLYSFLFLRYLDSFDSASLIVIISTTSLALTNVTSGIFVIVFIAFLEVLVLIGTYFIKNSLLSFIIPLILLSLFYTFFLKIANNSIINNKFSLFLFIFILFTIILDFFMISIRSNADDMAMIYLFSLLPIINALYDWLSVGITRGLLMAIAKRYHKTKEAFFWAILDIVLAIIFLVLISFTMIVVVGIANHIFDKVLLDLNHIFNQLETKTIWDNFWIYFMLFSTIIPTYIHFVIAGLSVIMWLPNKWRKWLIKDLEQKDTHKHILTFLYVTFTPILSLFIAIFMGWIVIKALVFIFSNKELGLFLLDIAKKIYSIF